MSTAAPSLVPPLPREFRAPAPVMRSAREGDAAALAALSLPFVRAGTLRERPASLYAAHAADFLVAQAPGGALDGCVGLRAHPGEGGGSAGVVYNFCVAGHRQGRGVGTALLRAVLAAAHARSLGTVFTATTGGGDLFLRYGFVRTSARLAPPSWAVSLDPRRGARILAKAL